MFSNYLRSTLRFLKQNKLFAGINALGLSLALAVSFIIFTFFRKNIMMDGMHRSKKKKYAVIIGIDNFSDYRFLYDLN